MKKRATSQRRWRIGELADATGLTVRTLHHYEHLRLLAPAARTEGRQRLYDESDVRRLYLIRALRDLGLSLADIGRMLDDDRAALANILRAHRARVEAELERLGRLRTLLDHACAHVDRDVDPDDVLATIEAMSRVVGQPSQDGARTMLNEQIAKDVGPAQLDIAWEQRGDPKHPTVLLVMGIAAQLVNWPLGFLQALEARSLHVVRFDNRDSGHSTHMRDAPPPNLPAALKGDLSSVSYMLSDMAADAVGLLDALKIDAAHVVGASLGGAIAQTMALEHPSRVRSLTTMMSTTGDMSVGQAHPATMKALFGGPPARTREEVVARAVRSYAVMGSPAFPTDPAAVAETAGLAYDRDYDEVAIARQAVASVASGDRTRLLRALDVPTLVLHGLADTLCDPSGGRATAAAIPGAELVLIDGMGHNLPPGLWERLADHIAACAKPSEQSPFRGECVRTAHSLEFCPPPGRALHELVQLLDKFCDTVPGALPPACARTEDRPLHGLSSDGLEAGRARRVAVVAAGVVVDHAALDACQAAPYAPGDIPGGGRGAYSNVHSWNP